MKIQQFRNLFPDVQIARFNMAAWQKRDSDSIFFIGREVGEPGKNGEPDTGVLKLFEVNGDGSIAHERVIWKPMLEGINLKDPRAHELERKNLIMGLTAVLRDKNGNPIPFPAVIKIDSHSSWQHDLPPFLVISTFGPGKNITPIDRTTYFFRPDALEYQHKLLVFSIRRQVPEKMGEIEFPKDLSWAQWRIGTTLPPLWVTPNEALFLIHGISLQEIDGQQKYVYSLGRAKLTRHGNQFSVVVAPEPILTPDHFLLPDGTPMVSELHPDIRRVVYCCGGLVKKGSPDRLSLYVNVGDRTTFEVDYCLDELKEGIF